MHPVLWKAQPIFHPIHGAYGLGLVCAVFVYYENNKIQSHKNRATKAKHGMLKTQEKGIA